MGKEKYNRSLQTTHGDKESVTETSPKLTTRTEYQIGGYYNQDGTTNQAAEQEFDRQKRAAADAYGVNPNTGRVERRFVSDILGVDPEIMKRKRAEEARLNQAKQKESGLYNALAVLGDMITTAGGGNVWERKADTHAKEAHDDNIKLQQEQQKEDIVNSNKLRATEQAYAEAVQNIRNSVGKMFQTKVSMTKEEGGKKTEKTTQGRDVTTGYIEGRNGSSAGRNGGSGDGGTMDYLPIKVHTNKGEETYRLSIPKAKKESIANELANVLALQPDYVERYSQYVVTTGKRGEEKTTIDLDRLINDGVYIDNPNIMNTFIDELQAKGGIVDKQGKPASRAQIYEMITGEEIIGDDGKVIPEKVLKGVRINGVDGTRGMNMAGRINRQNEQNNARGVR